MIVVDEWGCVCSSYQPLYSTINLNCLHNSMLTLVVPPVRTYPFHNEVCITHKTHYKVAFPSSPAPVRLILQSRCAALKRCDYIDLHNELVPYTKAWDIQKAIVKEKKTFIENNQDCPDTLILLQHPPVYTLGTGSSEEFLNFDVNDPPFDVFRTERGGEVTYHGPGQLVMYPVINLRNHKMDLHWYLRTLEEVVICALSSAFSIEATRLEGLTGVWIGNEKLAAIGIRVSQWITYHGLALNVSTDLSPFEQIVPCGIQNRKVGSIKKLLREVQASDDHSVKKELVCDDSVLIDVAHKSLVKEFCEVFQLELQQINMPNLLAEEKIYFEA